MRGVWAFVTVAACGRFDFDPLTDAGRLTDASAACTFSRWTTPVDQPDLDSTAADLEPTLNPVDGVTVVITSNRLAAKPELFVATRTGASSWSTPAAIPTIADASNNYAPVWTRAGTELYFGSDRAAGTPTAFVSSWDGATFGAPAPAAGFANQEFQGPAFDDDDLEMFFTTLTSPTQLMRATRTTTSSAWTIDGVVTELDDPAADDGWPTLSADGLTMFFESDRNSDPGNIYVATRPAIGSPFGTATAVTELNTPANDGDPDLSPDGLTLMLASDFGHAALDSKIFATSRTCN